MIRRTASRFITAIAFLTITIPCFAAPRPNVILLMADDMGWGDTSFSGNPNLQTPSLDAMAEAGLVFNRFYAASPVCSPTRASVLTGRHPFRNGIYFAMVPGLENFLPRNEITLGQLMRNGGYRTGFFGKWHLGTMTTEIVDGRFGGPDDTHLYSPPWEHGFDTVFATESRVPTYDPQIRPRNQMGAEPNRHPVVETTEGAARFWWEPLTDKNEGLFWGTHYWRGESEVVTEELSGDDSRIIIDEVIDFVEQEGEEDQPFFAVVWFHTPHLPLVAGPEDQARYSEHEFFERTYYGAVSAMDREVGRLRDALRARGLADNTLLWFTSDNGPESQKDITPGSTGGLRGRKRLLYEGGIRVPGIVEWPAGIEAGSQSQVPAVTTDLFPTVLGLAGIDAPAGRLLDGKDLGDVISGNAKSRNAPIGFESQYQVAWMDDRYKLVYVPSPDPVALRPFRHGQNPATSFDFELYDIVNDPGETTDLASEHPNIVARMSGQLALWRQSVASSIAADVTGEFSQERADLDALGRLEAVPAVYDAEGERLAVAAGEVKSLFFDALDYKGASTRAFAWLGIPAGASAENPVPGIVLVHGGGGSAHKNWVEMWNERGYAAISIAVEGQTDELEPGRSRPRVWLRHAWSGPARRGIYADSDEVFRDQWMYHAVADTVLANSLLRSLPQVDADKVGISGISWGGVITSTAIGIDTRYAFAIPIYGCGRLHEIDNQYAEALSDNTLYRQVWDSSLRIANAGMPVLWQSWPGDMHFALDSQAATYRATPGVRMVSLVPGMQHSHQAAWNRNESFEFADSVLSTGKPWCEQTDVGIDASDITVTFSCTRNLISASLYTNTGSGHTGEREWAASDARLAKAPDGTWTVSASLPPATSGWFVNVDAAGRDGIVIASSDYERVRTAKPNE